MTEKKSQANKEKGTEKKPTFNFLMGMTGKGLFGVASGYMVGSFVKQMTDMACFYAGLGFVLIGGLHYMQWISINFAQIDEDVLHLYQRAKTSAKDSGFVARLKRIFLRTVPLIGGFFVGFKFAFSKD